MPCEITEPPSIFPAYSSEVLFQISLFVLKVIRRTSPAVQWLGFCASTAGGPGSIPGQGTKIPPAVWHGHE